MPEGDGLALRSLREEGARAQSRSGPGGVVRGGSDLLARVAVDDRVVVAQALKEDHLAPVLGQLQQHGAPLPRAVRRIKHPHLTPLVHPGQHVQERFLGHFVAGIHPLPAKASVQANRPGMAMMPEG